MRNTQSSEIIEEDDKDQSIEVKIRKIISYQKSLQHAPSPLVSSSDSSSTSSRSFSSSNKSSSLLDLMKAGGMSLGRLFDMEHTSLATHMNKYSGSPVTRPIHLWGSDDDDHVTTYSWSPVLESLRRSTVESLVANEQISSVKDEVNVMKSVRRLSRKKSYRRLPRFRVLKGRGYRLLFRLGRLKVLICGRR